MKHWLDWKFSSGLKTGPDFEEFAKDFKRSIIGRLPTNAKLVKWHTGHYRLSGFVQSGEKFVYFSIPDVRYSPNGWYNSILVRVAKSEDDYTGGTNHFISLKDFYAKVKQLLEKGKIDINPA